MAKLKFTTSYGLNFGARAYLFGAYPSYWDEYNVNVAKSHEAMWGCVVVVQSEDFPHLEYPLDNEYDYDEVEKILKDNNIIISTDD